MYEYRYVSKTRFYTTSGSLLWLRFNVHLINFITRHCMQLEKQQKVRESFGIIQSNDWESICFYD